MNYLYESLKFVAQYDTAIRERLVDVVSNRRL
jgi:hypothetical protein